MEQSTVITLSKRLTLMMATSVGLALGSTRWLTMVISLVTVLYL